MGNCNTTNCRNVQALQSHKYGEHRGAPCGLAGRGPLLVGKVLEDPVSWNW